MPTESESDLMVGTLSVSGCPAYVLIDTGCSHSIISKALITENRWKTETNEGTYHIRTPLGLVNQTVKTCHNRQIRVAGRDLEVDMLVMELAEYDVLLGMDWLNRHSATINCPKREVKFNLPNRSTCILQCRKFRDLFPYISAIKTKHLLDARCTAYLASVVDLSVNTIEISNIPIVSKYPDVFPEEISGLPPK